ncbi:protein phosphatase 1 regulatory subunit 12A [Plutella xylostella]|uniref:protein phosphatase 1 regulatory subunit 12A n=1 Tax=Plutella xylostella TaxID=51655 RepID=UPI002032B07C|nr:protein phosphatase 1 regulatory subunit 12A [Plutella xylostella]
MDKRATSGRGEPIPSILKKPRSRRKGDLLDKSTKIKGEKVEGGARRSAGPGAPPQGCSALMYACQQADYKAVVDILNKDPAGVRARDRGLRCALHYCASSGAGVSQQARANCADRVLMAAPALADARDADGLTPLHLAVVHGNVPLVQTLLAAGADVNARDDEHHTVVHWATVCGEVGALRAVLAAGADAATPDQHGGYPLHYAAQMCGAPAATDHQSRGAALEVLRAVVKEGGARVEVRDADGRTPLLWAASAGSAAAVLALHHAGARPDDADRDGLTALHCAAARGHTEALETLVGLCGARVDVADSHGCTPLHYSAALGHADATAALLQHGADSQRQDRRGRSPAHTAAAKGQLETVRMLGARGANLWLRNSKGDLPLHEAVASGRRELVKWLLDGRPSQVNATNHEGRTPLHVAAATDNADLCRLLLDRGAEVNPVARSSKNEPVTPLDCATSRGHRSTAKYIQMHGGVPATKLTNTQIVIDGANITALPTRRVTSTKIDVRDRIRIEKREVVELSSPLQERRVFKDRNVSDTNGSSSDERKVSKRRSDHKYSDRHQGRRKRPVEAQKSFSDGYDTDLEARAEKEYLDPYDKKHKKGSKKSRSKSEPSKRGSRSAKHHHRCPSDSESSSETESYSNKKKSKRHRKRSKRKSTTSESSSSESSERRSTKRKGKKTSIHIENDEEKQSVNIVKYKRSASAASQKRTSENNASPEVSGGAVEDANLLQDKEDQVAKSKPQSDTETDTLSVKTNMIVTEAQIHMERQSSQQGNSELTVTVDSSNNVSIETSNLSVTHKDLTEGTKSDTEKVNIDDTKVDTQEIKDKSENIDTVPVKSVDADENKGEGTAEAQKAADLQSSKETHAEDVTGDKKDSGELETAETVTETTISPKEETSTVSPDGKKESSTEENKETATTTEAASEDKPQDQSPTPPVDIKRRKSFQVLAGPEDLLKESEHVDESDNQASQERNSSQAVSFANKDEIFERKESDKSPDNLMGEEVDHSEMEKSATDGETKSAQKESTDSKSSEEKRLDYASTTASSNELNHSVDKGVVTIIDSNVSSTDRAVQQIILENVAEDSAIVLAQSTPIRIRKTSKDSHGSSRKSSIYETESYKVLSDIASAAETGTSGILKKTPKVDESLENENEGTIAIKLVKNSSFGRVPSVSDNELYSLTESNGRRKRLRKKGRAKSRLNIRSKSENSERGYESSGLMDSGFEPSPRVVQRRIMSPRLAAYYQQRNATGRLSGKISDSRIPVRKPGDKNAVDMKSVTQRIQTNMRRYYCERKIFQHLLELKRLQIRTSKTNEAVLVKRAIEEYNKSSLAQVGLGPYNSPDFTFSSFEKFLYESLRKLQKSGKRHLDNLPEAPIDFDYGENELYKMSAIPDNPCLCTSKTHRCFHAVHAYTGIPCSAYIPYKWNHHTMPKPSTAGGAKKTKGFLPKINTKSPAGKPHVTLEVSHGSEKQLIALPAEKLDRNKRYYVTFTVKGSEPPSDNDNVSPKSVRSG